jgi:hypothetical protein
VARGPTVGRRASPDSPRNLHCIESGPAGVLLITQLRQHMACLRLVPAARHASPTTFVHSDLEKCTHIFLCQDTTRRSSEPPYSGPYQVLSRRQKTLQLLTCGKPVTVSANRVKPAYIFNGTDCENTTFNPVVDATPTVAPPAAPPPTT